MGDTEERPLLVVEVAKETELPPPPVYQQLEQQEPQASGNSASPPKYTVATPIPLPTYDQSEKYEKDGVLQVSSSSSEQETSEPVRRWTSGSGTCFEFIVFFIVCAAFSLVGFVFSFCLATTTAAQSGAIAGLGTAFISKPLLYEFYYRGYEEQWSQNWCADYGDSKQHENCLQWSTNTIRTLFFIIGLFGLILLYKGLSGFFRSRGSSNN